jgi:hypothetical protein
VTILSSGSPIVFLIVVAFAILTYVADWIIFTKADHPGWASLIPFYNLYVVLKIVGRPGWWLILFFIPFVNIIVAIIVAIDMSKSFGHGGGFALGLIFLGPIFHWILAFGDSQYKGPAALGATA